MPYYRAWLAGAGVQTDDGRTFATISWRDLPLPLAFQTDVQHAAFPTSEQVGQIVALEMDGAGNVSALLHVDPRDDNNRPIHAEGARAASMIEAGGQGISMDGLVPPDATIDEECISEDDDGWCLYATVTFSEVVVGGATLTPIPAFSQAIVDPTPLDENGQPLEDALALPLVASAAVASVPALLARSGFPLTAAAAVDLAAWELRPEHFTRPTLTAEANYINVEDDGRVWGWIAAAERCHQSFPGSCVLAADQSPDLSDFLRNVLPIGDQRVPVGFLTMDMGHAPGDVTPERAAALYDDTRSIAAILTAGIVPAGEYSEGSTWFSGSVSPRLNAWQRTVLAAGQVSGDWRADPGQALRTLRAALVVPVPGFLRNREPVYASGTCDVCLSGPYEDVADHQANDHHCRQWRNRSMHCATCSTRFDSVAAFKAHRHTPAASGPASGCGCGGSAGVCSCGQAAPVLSPAQAAALARVADDRLEADLRELDADLALSDLPAEL